MKIVLRDRAELSTNPATRLTECVSSVDPDILILTTELSISMSIHCMPACRCISDSAVFQMCLAESCTSTAPSATGALVHLMCQFINLKWQHHILVLYVADLLQLIKRHQLVPHGYADDTQIYGFCQPCDVDVLSDKMSACSDEALSWMRANRLQANPSKTEVL